MKKLFGTVCAVLSVAACIGAMAACDRDNDGDASGGNITKDTDPKTIVSERMTKAEWDTAFSEASFNNVEYFNSYSNDMGYGGSFHNFYDGDKRKSEQKDGDEPLVIAYQVKENGRYYYIADEGNGYVKRDLEYDSWDELSIFTSGAMGMMSRATDYSKAVWNDGENGYAVSVGEDIPLIFKFKDKKVAAFYFQGQSPDLFKGLFYNYGTTSVTLPQYTDESTHGGSEGGAVDEDTDPAEYVSEKINADKLIAAQESAAFDKVIYYVGLGDQYTRLTCDGNLKKYESTMGGAVAYYLSKEGDTFYKYEKEGNVYKKEETTAKEWSDLTLPSGYIMLQFFANASFSDLTWSDSENGYLYPMGVGQTVVLKFADGALALYYLQGEADGMKGVLYEYGSASVSLPDLNKQIVDEDTDPTTLVSDELTPEGWTAAFAESNFENVSLYMNDVHTQDSVVIDSNTVRVVTADNKSMLSQKNGENNPYVNYVEKDGANYYTYTMNGQGKWVKNNSTQNEYNYSTVYYMVSSFLAAMKSHEWNGEGGYTCVMTSNAGDTVYTLKFVDKKIAAIYAIGEVKGVFVNSVMLFYGYGESDVPLPDVSTDTGTGDDSHTHIDKDGDELCDLCGEKFEEASAPPVPGTGDETEVDYFELDPATLISDQIDVNEWNKIVDRGQFGNFTLYYRNGEEKQLYVYNDREIMFKAGPGSAAIYYGLDGDAYCKYNYNGDGYEKLPVENDEYNLCTVDTILSWLFELDGTQAVWSSEANGYLIDNPVGEGKLVFVFKDDMLYACYVLGNGNMHKWFFTKYYQSHIIFPAIPLTEAEWNAAFSAANASNVKVSIMDESTGAYTIAHYEENLLKLETMSKETEQWETVYYKKENGKSYRYVSGAWQEEDGYAHYLLEFSVKYEQFTYANIAGWNGTECVIKSQDGEFTASFDSEKRLSAVEVRSEEKGRTNWRFEYGNEEIELPQ